MCVLRVVGWYNGDCTEECSLKVWYSSRRNIPHSALPTVTPTSTTKGGPSECCPHDLKVKVSSRTGGEAIAGSGVLGACDQLSANDGKNMCAEPA